MYIYVANDHLALKQSTILKSNLSTLRMNLKYIAVYEHVA